MPRSRRTHTRRYSRERKIQHRQWFTSSGVENKTGVNLKAGADTDNVIKIAVDALKGDDCTILRTRGFINVFGTNFAVDTIGALGGIVLPNKTANNASTSDLPNPLVDADSTDWFVWTPIGFQGSLADSGDATPEDQQLSVLQIANNIDSKAKRIMEASDSVVWILGLNPQAAVTSKALDFMYCIRTLVGY